MPIPPRKILLVAAALALATLACSLSALSLGQPQPTVTSLTLFSVPAASAGDGLTPLNRYQTSLSLEFEGKRNGQTSAGKIEQTTDIDRQNVALRQQQTIDAVIPNRKNRANAVDFVSAGGAVFVRQDGTAFWFEPKIDQPVTGEEFGILPLAGLLVLPQTVTVAPKFEQLDGVNVQQYQFTEKDLTSPELIFKQAKGAVWLSTADNSVRQYQISGTVRALSPAAGAHLFDEAQLQLRYRLTVDAPPLAPPPAASEAIPPALAQLPRLPDAHITAAYPALLEYRSVISPVSATLYYRSALPPLGWTEVITSIFNEKARLTFDRPKERLSVIITPAETPPQIKIVVNLEQRP